MTTSLPPPPKKMRYLNFDSHLFLKPPQVSSACRPGLPLWTVAPVKDLNDREVKPLLLAEPFDMVLWFPSRLLCLWSLVSCRHGVFVCLVLFCFNCRNLRKSCGSSAFLLPYHPKVHSLKNNVINENTYVRKKKARRVLEVWGGCLLIYCETCHHTSLR